MTGALLLEAYPLRWPELVGRPSRDDAAEVFRRHLRGRPLADAVDPDELGSVAVSSLYDPGHAIYRVHRSDGLPKTITLGHLTSGAQIAGIVDTAASEAIDRELGGGAPGISPADVEAAVARISAEQRHVDHADEIALFCEPFKRHVTEIERVRERSSSKEN